MSTDKTQIGLTPQAKDILDEVVNSGAFEDGQAAVRFSIAVAITEGVQPGRAEGASTGWHTRGLDPEGELAALVTSLFPEASAEPYRTLEHFMNEGLRLIGDRTKSISIDGDKHARRLSDIVKLVDPVEDSSATGSGSAAS